MAQNNDRFVWALSFLDLFTCALGAVFMLTILAVRERDRAKANDPFAFAFVAVHYDTVPLQEKDAVVVVLPEGFDPAGEKVLRKPDQARLVVISLRVPAGQEVGGDRQVRISLPRAPDRIDYGNETVGRGVWPGTDGAPPPRFDGRGYRVTIDWKK